MNLNRNIEDEGEVIDIKSSFIDGMSVINIFRQQLETINQYIYIDSDGTVQLKSYRVAKKYFDRKYESIFKFCK